MNAQNELDQECEKSDGDHQWHGQFVVIVGGDHASEDDGDPYQTEDQQDELAN